MSGIFRSHLILAIASLSVVISSSQVIAQQAVAMVSADATWSPARSLSDDRLFAWRDSASLPVNLEVPSVIQGRVREIWRRSVTFRRQCALLALAKEWHVEVTFQGTPLANALAMTHFGTGSRAHRAVIVLVAPDMHMAELLAHEMEHVLEQIDGVDLPRLSEAGAIGVTRVSDHGFETQRAINAGKRVAREFIGVSERAAAGAAGP